MPKRQRPWFVWLIPLVAGVLLLIGAKLSLDFYRDYRDSHDSEVVSSVQEIGRLAHSLASVKAARIVRVLQGETWEKMAPRLRVPLFLVTMASVLTWAAVLLFYECLFLFVNHGERSNRFAPYLWLRNLVLGVASLGMVCMLYGFLVEPYWLEVTHARIETPKLPHGAQIRIVHFSDLHMARKPRLEPRLSGVIAEQKPDLIVFAGDAMNSAWALGRFKQFLLAASQIAPVFLVKGNQDGGTFWDSKDIYKGTGAHELKGQVETLNVRGTGLWIRGAADADEYAKLPSNPPPVDSFSIFVQHRPDSILEVARDRYDLYLCGHTHGGQIALPFYGALVTYSKFDKQFEAGLYRVGPTSLYVNRGIGLAKWPQAQARFFARPELTVIDLVGK